MLAGDSFRSECLVFHKFVVFRIFIGSDLRRKCIRGDFPYGLGTVKHRFGYECVGQRGVVILVLATGDA